MQLGNIKKLFTEDRAVSPVIGVILMVAITVILAAVIGTFVLGLGDDLQDTSPTASVDFDFDHNESGAPDVTVTHQGGDTISENDQLTVTATGEINETELDESVPIFESQSWSAGQSETVSANAMNEDGVGNGNWKGNTVRVNWASPDGENSATLASSTAPTA